MENPRAQVRKVAELLECSERQAVREIRDKGQVLIVNSLDDVVNFLLATTPVEKIPLKPVRDS